MRPLELSVNDIKKKSLEIVIDVDSFCRNNNIRYSLAYGSLLGAVRHKGYIPWDDDVDLMMPRDDYERFCREYKSDHFSLACSSNNSKCFISYARVYDSKDTFSTSLWPWLKPEKGVGVWIDIFPIDAVSDNYDEYCKEYKIIQHYYRMQGIARGALANLDRVYSLRSNLKVLAKRVLFLGGLISPNSFTVKMSLEAFKKDYSETIHCAQLMCSQCPADEYYYLKEWFDDFIDIEFEGKLFRSIRQYDAFLTVAYGDYMTLPPVEKRTRHHGTVKYYFKNSY